MKNSFLLPSLYCLCISIFFSTSLFAQVPGNDLCSNAISLQCGDIVAGSNFGGTNNGPACAGGADGTQGGVWYTFSGTGQNVTVIVNADPTGLTTDLADSQLAVYQDNCTNLICLGGNDDATPPGDNGSAFNFNSVIGTDYYFYVNGFLSLAGDFEISVDCMCAPPVANIVFDNAHCSVDGTFDLVVNVTSLGDATSVDITHDGTSPDSFSGVGTGAYTLSGFSSSGDITVSVVNSSSATCLFTETLNDLGCAPINDLCANAIPAVINPIGSGCNTLTMTTNIGASDSGELPTPQCGFYSGGDTWYTINIPADGQLQISYNTGNYSSVCSAIYTGTCGNVVELACTVNFFNTTENLSGLPPGPALLRIWDFFNDDIGVASFCLEGDVPLCPPDFTGPNSLSGNVSSGTITDFETPGGITSAQIIDVNTDYDSGVFVEMNPGFEVILNSIFDAFIDPSNCNNGAGGNQ